jgi:hypothetical protein
MMVQGIWHTRGTVGISLVVGMRRMQGMQGTRVGQFLISEYTCLPDRAGFDWQEFPGEDCWSSRM